MFVLDPAPAASSAPTGTSIPMFPTPQGSWIPPWAWQIMAGFFSLWVIASFIGLAFPHTRIGRVCRRWSLDVTDMVSVLRTGKHIERPPSDPPSTPPPPPAATKPAATNHHHVEVVVDDGEDTPKDKPPAA